MRTRDHVITNLLHDNSHYYGSYTIVRGRIRKRFLFRYCIFEFESTVASSALCVVVGFGWKRMSLSMLRPLNHPRNISAVKPESEP